jgi:hypothetical protein
VFVIAKALGVLRKNPVFVLFAKATMGAAAVPSANVVKFTDVPAAPL